MKLHEIHDTGIFTQDEDIINWIKTNAPNDDNIFTINDSVVDTSANVFFKSGKIPRLRVNFGTVKGTFALWFGADLETTDGFPKNVVLRFDVAGSLSTKITSLIGCPLEVGSSYIAADNFLTSLEGAPVSIGGHFCINNNFHLTSLKHGPHSVEGDYKAANTSITSLEGVARHIKYVLEIYDTKIVSLCGISDKIDHLGGITIKEHQIESGGIGLLLVEGFEYISVVGHTPKWVDIINKYTGRPDDIFECQMELIEAGYEAHAQL